MNRDRVLALVVEMTEHWVQDPDSDVVWAGEYEGRLGVRMKQRVRDFTTVWFDVGDRTMGCEAYVLPSPPQGREEVFRQCLLRNERAWRVHFAIDGHGDVFLRGRMPLEAVTAEELDLLLGEVYELVELSFRGLVRAAFGRREKKT
ncbi:MAG: YbjN domain-containing protein [Acidimicrobiia bacterium]